TSVAVEPVPSPTTIPHSTKSAAARAARTFERFRSLSTARLLPLYPLVSHRPLQKKGRPSRLTWCARLSVSRGAWIHPTVTPILPTGKGYIKTGFPTFPRPSHIPD